ncbi:hypothetical protein RUND412_000458 [Rhizina undulata]
MADSTYPPVPTSDPSEVTKESAAQQIVNGTHPVIQNTKADFRGLANSAICHDADGEQRLTHYHNFFCDLLTWKYPRATGFFFFSLVSLILAFHYVNVLRYVFKAAYILFASVTLLEVAAKPFGSKGVVSSMRPRRYYTIPRDSLERLFGELHDLLNFFVFEFQRVVFVENIYTTVSAFLVSFFGYFLIKYIPLWSLLLLTTISAFTAPLIYLQNKQFIDAQIHHASEFANEQLINGRHLTEKYAGDAIAVVRATAVELAQKVRGNDFGTRPSSHEFPTAPTHEFPTASTQEPPTAPTQEEKVPAE